MCKSVRADYIFVAANATVACFKATLKLMGPLPGQMSALYDCNSLVDIRKALNIPLSLLPLYAFIYRVCLEPASVE